MNSKRLKEITHSSIICWYEIPANNVENAVAFYKNVFNLNIDIVLFNGINNGILSSPNRHHWINGAINCSQTKL